MALNEFEIIRRYFTRQPSRREEVLLGIGDDAAVLRIPAGQDLVVCTDTLVAGVHFPAGTAAAAIGHKALAVNLSDLAAMGADPLAVTLALTLPESDPAWLGEFSRGLLALAGRYHLQLIGGDITRGPLTVTVQAHGLVPAGQALRRQGARPGDRVYVTGTLGDAGLALHLGDAATPQLRQRLDYPEPRIAAGRRLRSLASAAIDISDGLLADLEHLLESDRLGANLRLASLPRSQQFETAFRDVVPQKQKLYQELPLTAGDDYELCFTVPPDRGPALTQALAGLPCRCTPVGEVTQQPGVRCLREDGSEYRSAAGGYRHFG
ncbi:MAG: thiamine-phosphate kinase [Gammaproteobacteria bacterium]|jgi:thiamine-monophosphate kinase